MSARRQLVGMAVAAVLASANRPADACTCGFPGGTDERTYPGDGATDVPPNTRLLVVRLYQSIPVVRLRHEGTGELVELAIDHWERFWDTDQWVMGTPAVELTPGEAYLLEVAGEVASRFEVGDARDDVAPPAVPLTELVLRSYPNPAECNSGICWEGGDELELMTVRFDPPDPDVVMVLVEVSTAGAAEPAFAKPVRRYDPIGGDEFAEHTCNTHPPELLAGQDYCARLVAYDGAGNVTAGAPVCETTASCFAIDCDPSFSGDCVPFGDPGPDAGTEPAGDTGCGCAVGGRGALAAWWWLGAVMALLVARRRRAGAGL